MPKKRSSKGNTKSQKKQEKRLKELESFVYKTIENKQLNYSITATSMSSTGYATKNFMALAAGAEDGQNLGDSARVGNSITLLKQQFGFNFLGSSTDTYNQIRVILAESTEGAQDLALSDILYYSSYQTHGDNVFSSPYTTKAATNKRYKVHMDKCFCISGLATKGGVPPAKVIRHVIKWPKGKVIEYDGPDNKNPSNHRMNLFVITDSVSATHPSMSYNVRTIYKDA